MFQSLLLAPVGPKVDSIYIPELVLSPSRAKDGLCIYVPELVLGPSRAKDGLYLKPHP